MDVCMCVCVCERAKWEQPCCALNTVSSQSHLIPPVPAHPKVLVFTKQRTTQDVECFVSSLKICLQREKPKGNSSVIISASNIKAFLITVYLACDDIQ